MKKRILSMVLCICLVLSMVPATVRAATVEEIHDFTASGKNSTFYTITGNLSTSKGTVSYDGKTLTQCLKMESETNISFNAPAAGTLKLVFGPASGKRVKIDGSNHTVGSDNILTVAVDAGSHTITKGDSINLFYMVFTYEGSGGGESGGTTDPECDHANTTTTTVDASCGVAGSVTVTCDACHAIISKEEIPATGNHTYDKENPTGKCTVCTQDCGHSYTGGVCTICGVSQSQHEHSFKADSVKDYRWTADYSHCVAYCKCTECGEYVVFEATDIEVDYGTATCDVTDTITYTATFAEGWITDGTATVSNVKNHKWEVVELKAAATCLADGYVTERCTACLEERTVVIPAAHTYTGDTCQHDDAGFTCAADKTNTKYVHAFNDGMRDPEGFFTITGAEDTKKGVAARVYNNTVLGRCLKMSNSNSGNNEPFSLSFKTLTDDDANGIDGDGVLILITDAREGNNFTTLTIQAEGGNSVNVIMPKDGIMVLAVTQGTTYTITKTDIEGLLYYVEYIPGAVLKNATDDDNDAESAFAAEIDGIGYYTLGEAVAAAEPGDIITLLRNTTEEVTVGGVLTEAGTTITICLHEHTAPNIKVASGCKKDTVSCSKGHGEDIVITKLTTHTCVEGDPVKENEVEATCTTDGSYDSVVYCTGCDTELSRETITVPATGHTEGDAVQENVVEATCHSAGSYDSVVYCSKCDTELSRETITVPATGEHVDENGDGVCDTDGCGADMSNVAYIDLDNDKTWDEGTETAYKTLAEALEAAGDAATDAANVYVRLLVSELTEKYVIIPVYVVLDIEANTLTADYVVGFNGSFLIADRYSTSAAYGKLFVKKDIVLGKTARIVDGREIMPFWDPEQGCYVFAKLGIWKEYEKNGLVLGTDDVSGDPMIKFSFLYKAGTDADAKFLEDALGADDNKLRFVVRLLWTNELGEASQDFVYNAELVQDVADDGNYFTFTLTNYEELSINLDTLEVTALIITDAGVIAAGETFTIEANTGNDAQ